ncbi:hypothetical protein BDZ45DRAFT_609014 [Acephala macrosclerotiorum]|nr:hypothetical protein BDZ45DRAFT_609014 [Acephala macrosclerotiorum]
MILLLPSFVTVLWPWQKRDDANQISPTAYLNGVRGIAAYSVYWQHFLTIFYGGDRLFSWHARPQDTWIIQFPYISLFHSGMFPVTTFFILSGFVLSYRPLQYVRSYDYEAVLNNLSSSVFRRGLRLFLPVIPPLIGAAICIHYGYYGRGGQPTLSADLEVAFWQFERLVNFFDTNNYFPGSIPPLYTLPVEFRGSMMVFLCVLGVSRLRPWTRMGVLACICWYGLYHGAWETFLFLAGVILAEMRLIREDSNSKDTIADLFRNPKHLRYSRYAINVFWVLLLVTGLYIGSIPVTQSLSAPGYSVLASLAPTSFQQSDHFRALFWCSIGSALLILSLENFPPLQYPFATRLVQYLGNISFSLYILHIPVIHTVGRSIATGWIKWAEVQGLDGSWGWMIGGFAMTPLLFWVADVQWRLVDEGSVKFARWMERKLLTGKRSILQLE